MWIQWRDVWPASGSARDLFDRSAWRDAATRQLQACQVQNQSEARIRDLALAQHAANFGFESIRFQRVREQSQVADPDWIYSLEQQLDSLRRHAS